MTKCLACVPPKSNEVTTKLSNGFPVCQSCHDKYQPLVDQSDEYKKTKLVEGFFSKPQSNGLVKCLKCESFFCGKTNREGQREHIQLAHQKELDQLV